MTIIVVGIGDRTQSAGIADPHGDAAPHHSVGRAVAVRLARATEIKKKVLSWD